MDLRAAAGNGHDETQPGVLRAADGGSRIESRLRSEDAVRPDAGGNGRGGGTERRAADTVQSSERRTVRGATADPAPGQEQSEPHVYPECGECFQRGPAR